MTSANALFIMVFFSINICAQYIIQRENANNTKSLKKNRKYRVSMVWRQTSRCLLFTPNNCNQCQQRRQRFNWCSLSVTWVVNWWKCLPLSQM